MRFLPILRYLLGLALLFLCAACGDRDRVVEPRDGGRDSDVSVVDGDQDLVCSGDATPCEARSLERCGSGAGCFEIGSCEEIPRSCSELPADVCGTIPGCAWFELTGRCGLLFLDCARGTDRDGCSEIAGCTWVPRCAGAPLACDQLSEGQCLDQDGCALTPNAGIAR